MDKIEIEADTLESARAQIKSHIPSGYFCLSETIVSDGSLKNGRAKICIEIEADNLVAQIVENMIREFDQPDQAAGTGPDGETYIKSSRREAAVKLGRIGHPHATDVLIKWLSDPNEETREAAALALGRIGASRAVDALVDIALRDNFSVYLGSLSPTYIVRCAAILALKEIGDDKALQALTNVPVKTLTAVDSYQRKRGMRILRG